MHLLETYTEPKYILCLLAEFVTWRLAGMTDILSTEFWNFLCIHLSWIDEYISSSWVFIYERWYILRIKGVVHKMGGHTTGNKRYLYKCLS